MTTLMRDVAKRAGVSATTVSHTLNGTRLVAPETRERILQAIRDLGYHKNASARLLVRGRSDSFGLIISDIEDPFYPGLVKSFEGACLTKGLDVVLCMTNYQTDQANRAVQRLIENKVQGVAIMTSQLDQELVDELLASNTPVVMRDNGPVGRSRSNVSIDYAQAASLAVEHLYHLGHRKFAIVAGPRDHTSAVAYEKRVLEALRSRRLDPVCIVEGNNRTEGGADAVAHLLKNNIRPTAIIAGNDLMAVGATAAALEAGLRVPQDVSIVGFDDILTARFSYPPLTTVSISRNDLGLASFEALNHMLRTKRRTGIERVIHAELVVRQSTARVS
jgi:DNA-binding LacI/PurR family transcriptional regulator